MIIETIKKISIICTIIMLCSTFTGQQQFLNELNAIDDSQYDDLIEYFNDVAIGDYYIERWEQPVYIELLGDYTDEDYATISRFVDEIDSLGIMKGITIVDEHSNCKISFEPLDQMPEDFFNYGGCAYKEGDWWAVDLNSSEYGIREVTIGIVNDVTTQEQRNYMILRTITYALGFYYSSDKYPDSILYSEWTNAQSLSDLDYIIISMLYLDKLHSGMYEDEAEDILRPWVKTHISATPQSTENDEAGALEELA